MPSLSATRKECCAEMPYNCRFVGVDFVGTILVVGRNKDEFCDVPEADFLMYHLREV